MENFLIVVKTSKDKGILELADPGGPCRLVSVSLADPGGSLHVVGLPISESWCVNACFLDLWGSSHESNTECALPDPNPEYVVKSLHHRPGTGVQANHIH